MPDPDLLKDLKREDLVYTSDDKPGYFRQKAMPAGRQVGKKFNYYDTDGKRITEKNVIARINKLAIPPAWRDVWISPRTSGHLQATGIDDRKRKQYIYHPDWVKISQENKFEKMIDFAASLPKIRDRISYSLREKDLDKSKILATVIWLLDKTFVRVGNEEYSRENKSFGLTTLRNRHAKVRGDEITFKFRGKSGVENIIEVSNPTVAKTIKRCIELPGFELFQFIDDEGNRHVIDSADVNEFLKDLTRDNFTAKDFRTWGATNLSAKHLHEAGNADDEKSVKENIITTVKHVATHLNNTVSVCRSYYIHPTVLTTYAKKVLVPHFDGYSKDGTKKEGLSWREYALVKLLEKYTP